MTIRITQGGAAQARLWSTAASLSAGIGLALAGVACGPATPTAGKPASQTAPASVGGSSVSGGGSGGTTAKACNLFTKADVQTAFGHAVVKVDGLDGPAAGESLCTFGLDDQGGILVQIYATRQSAAGATLNEAGSEQVSGLGDSAFWVFTTGTLFVRKGERGLSIINPYAATPGVTAASQAEIDAANAAARDKVVGLSKLAASKW